MAWGRRSQAAGAGRRGHVVWIRCRWGLRLNPCLRRFGRFRFDGPELRSLRYGFSALLADNLRKNAILFGLEIGLQIALSPDLVKHTHYLAVAEPQAGQRPLNRCAVAEKFNELGKPGARAVDNPLVGVRQSVVDLDRLMLEIALDHEAVRPDADRRGTVHGEVRPKQNDSW